MSVRAVFGVLALMLLASPPPLGAQAEWDGGMASTPWVRLDAGVEDDDQPLRATAADLRGGLRPLPWLSGEVSVGIERHESGPTTETLASARARIGARWDRFGLTGSAWGGGIHRASVGSQEWIGGATVAFHGPAGLVVRAETLREPYLLTAASLALDRSVIRARGALEREDPDGWAGGLSYGEDRFRDEHQVEEASAWFLAPVANRPAGLVRFGYRFHLADAAQSAFEPVEPRTLDRAGRLVGRYAPVYTPRELRSHSLLVEVRHERPGMATLVLDGSWGFEAQEDRPLLFPAVPGVPEAGTDLQFRRRSFTPWHVGAKLRWSVTPELALSVSGGYRTTAFRGRWFLETSWLLHPFSGGSP